MIDYKYILANVFDCSTSDLGKLERYPKTDIRVACTVMKGMRKRITIETLLEELYNVNLSREVSDNVDLFLACRQCMRYVYKDGNPTIYVTRNHYTKYEELVNRIAENISATVVIC